MRNKLKKLVRGHHDLKGVSRDLRSRNSVHEELSNESGLPKSCAEQLCDFDDEQVRLRSHKKMDGRDLSRRCACRPVGETRFDLRHFPGFAIDRQRSSHKTIAQPSYQHALHTGQSQMANEVERENRDRCRVDGAPIFLVIPHLKFERATPHRKPFDLKQKTAHRRLRQIGISRPDGGSGAFAPGFVDSLAAQRRFHYPAKAMDRLPVALEKPAADLDSPAKANAIRQRVEMEEILRGGLRGRGGCFYSVCHGKETRGGKASVKPPETSDKLGL